VIDALFVKLDDQVMSLRRAQVNQQKYGQDVFCEILRGLKHTLSEIEQIKCGGQLSSLPSEDAT